MIFHFCVVLHFSENYETASEGSFDVSITAMEIPSSLEDLDDDIETKDMTEKASEKVSSKAKVNDYLDLMDCALMSSSGDHKFGSKNAAESNSDPMEEDLDYEDLLDEDNWH